MSGKISYNVLSGVKIDQIVMYDKDVNMIKASGMNKLSGMI